MCTIMTVSYRLYAQFSRLIEERITLDGRQNDDGISLVLVGADGASLSVRSLDPEPVLQALRTQTWSRAFVHQRAATQGYRSLANVHGWQSVDGWFYMHNGSLLDPDTSMFSVDSQLIGQWLDDGGPALALRQLENEWFANVLLVSANPGDPQAGYWLSRSGGGTLFTDGRGNYSTAPIVGTGIVRRVPAKTQTWHALRYARRSRRVAEAPQAVEPEVLDPVGESALDRPTLPATGRVWAEVGGQPQFVFPSEFQPTAMFWLNGRLVEGRRLTPGEVAGLGSAPAAPDASGDAPIRRELTSLWERLKQGA